MVDFWQYHLPLTLLAIGRQVDLASVANGFAFFNHARDSSLFWCGGL